MTDALSGQVALVTGAGRGIGRGCALALAEQGARVIGAARSESDLAALSEHASGRIETWVADVCDDAFPDRVRAIEGLSILINNAGANRPAPIDEVTTADLDFVVDLNIRAAYRAAQAAVQSMLGAERSGVIINMSSQMGHVGSPKRTVYCMTKHAIEGLTKAMAVELAPHAIRVNSVAPTFVETPLTRPMLDNPEFRDFVLGMIPMGKLASIDDVVQAVMYLVSSGAAMVTGHSLVVDGGWTVR
ncbi:MAG: SDR family oxidoreductase [Pseudomonadota bacterium]